MKDEEQGLIELKSDHSDSEEKKVDVKYTNAANLQKLMIVADINIDAESFTLREWIGDEKSYTKPIGEINFMI